MKRLLIAAGMTLMLLFAGCSKSADEISASYVSPLTYRDYSCSQLSAELGRLTSRVAQVAGIQDNAASNDAVVTGVTLVLFWPAVFMLEGNSGREGELGRLRGELEAIEMVAIRKDCSALTDDLKQRRVHAAKAARERKKKEAELAALRGEL